MRLVFLLCLLAGASWQDLRCKKVSNYWIVLGVACYVAAGFIVFIRGPSGDGTQVLVELSVFFLRFFSVVFLLFFFFFFRMMGASDIKIMALIGGYLGLREGFVAIFYGLSAAALWSLFFMIRKKILRYRIQYFICYFYWLLSAGECGPYYDKGRDGIQAGFALVPFLWLGLLIHFLEQGGVV